MMNRRVKLSNIILTFITIIAACLCSCTKKEDDEILSIPSSVTIYFGDKYQLNSYQEWKSSKPFIATVDGSGTIVANHAGGCTVSCPKGSCTVNVIPTTTLYNEPICGYDVTPNIIISKYGQPDYWNDNYGYMVYETGVYSTPYMYFKYDTNTGRLKGSVIIIKRSLLDQLCEHLNQRYARQDANYYIWADEYINNNSNITKYVSLKEAYIPLIGTYGETMYYTDCFGVWYEPVNP